jgi:hypothetical protein
VWPLSPLQGATPTAWQSQFRGVPGIEGTRASTHF